MTAERDRLAALSSFGGAMADAVGVEVVLDTALEAMDDLLGFRHVLLLVHQDDAEHLTTIASHGYDVVGIGSEVQLGEGVIGKVAELRRPMRIGNLQRMLAYARTVRSTSGAGLAAAEVQLPGLVQARSQLAAPMIADGVLLGVIAAESERALAFDEVDQLVLTIAAQLVAGALERAEIIERVDAPAAESADDPPVVPEADGSPRPSARLRHYAADGSVFIDDEYVIKGVAGRLLWKLASEHVGSGRTAYTNREVRLDPALDMPTFRDNFESRLVLLKRRLEERDAPIRIHRTGRGRFEVESTSSLVLDLVGRPA